MVVDYGIPPQDQYNFDETGFRIGVGGSQWIITMEVGKKHHTIGSDSNRDYVTSVETISGNGEALPPLLIVQGVNHLHQWYTNTELPDDYSIATSPSGYSNDQLAYAYLLHFDEWSSRRQVGVWRLLIFDDFGSHLTKEFIDYCDNKKIIPFGLPPHTSHLLQPLDVGVFQPFKYYHKEAAEMATRTGCTNFNKVEFLNAIHNIRAKTFQKSIILSAWEQSGLIPFNPVLVTQKIKVDEEQARPKTPEFPLPLWQCSPRTPKTTAKYAEYVRERLSSPRNRRKISLPVLLRLVDAAVGNSLELALATKQLQEVQAAVRKRAERQKPNQKVVQKGGVIKVGDVRLTIIKRNEEDLKKVQKAAAQKGNLLPNGELVVVQYEGPPQNHIAR